MHFLYLFYNFCTTLHVSNDHFVHHQQFMIYCILQLCTNRANVSAWSYGWNWLLYKKCLYNLTTYIFYADNQGFIRRQIGQLFFQFQRQILFNFGVVKIRARIHGTSLFGNSGH
jgi:hypothetical protein